MFKYLNPKRFYYAVGKKKFLEFILLAVFMLFFYGPLMYMCITAFGNVYEVPNIFPTEWGFKWWNFVFSQKSLVSSIVQSLTIAVITTVCSMVLCIPAAYSLARFRFPGRKVFMLSFLLTNAFPKLGIYTSIGILFYKYNLMGTLLGVVIIHMINSMMFMVWLPCSAFQAVHKQQEEAARDVGAGPIRTFFLVVLPMMKPTFISVGVLEIMWVWNDYLLPYLVLDGTKYMTIPILIQYFRGGYGRVELAPMMACIIIAIIPIIILYMTCQKYIIEGVVAGAVKG